VSNIIKSRISNRDLVERRQSIMRQLTKVFQVVSTLSFIQLMRN